MAAQSKGVSTPVVFNFNSLSIRAITDEQGNPWFVAKDVCNILGYSKCSQAIKDNCRADGVSTRSLIDRMGRKQSSFFINEGNLYRLIIKSKKPEAEKFERQVMEEILPAIRKTGSYSGLPNPSTQSEELAELIRIQKRLLKSLPNPDCLLPPDQAKEISERLDRLASMFHPFSNQFGDVFGVIRALRGLHPRLGTLEPGYRKVMEHPAYVERTSLGRR